MTAYDTELQKLQEQVARFRRLLAVTGELRRQRETFAARARQLEAAMRDEQADVDRLEGRSLAAFFYSVTGKMGEKLDQERREAYEARVKYDAAAHSLAEVEEELRRSERELETLRGCEERYQAALAAKADAVKAAGGEAAGRVLEQERRLLSLASQARELDEAVGAGRAALRTTESVLSLLGDAEGWGTWDLIGGGLLTDMAKHSRLDEAQREIETLQTRLRRFKTELADVEIQADIQVSVEGFLRFADYFFDGLFADWTVLGHIRQSQEQVRGVEGQIQNVLFRLEAQQSAVGQEREQRKAALDQLVREARL